MSRDDLWRFLWSVGVTDPMSGVRRYQHGEMRLWMAVRNLANTQVINPKIFLQWCCWWCHNRTTAYSDHIPQSRSWSTLWIADQPFHLNHAAVHQIYSWWWACACWYMIQLTEDTNLEQYMQGEPVQDIGTNSVDPLMVVTIWTKDHLWGCHSSSKGFKDFCNWGMKQLLSKMAESIVMCIFSVSWEIVRFLWEWYNRH